MSVSEIVSFFIETWWLWFGLCLLYIYSKYKNKESVMKFSIQEMFLIIQLGLIIFVILLFQVYVFNQHSWFIITLPFFIGIWWIFINHILSQGDIYMIETAFLGEQFHNPEENKTVMSLSTRIRLIIMDKSFYETKKHIGDMNNPLWNVSSSIKFCNFYDENTGIFYHSEYPQLQNVNFYACVMLWLKLKEDIPKLMRENLILTWLSDWNIAHGMTVVGEDFRQRLVGIKEAVSKDPFSMPKSIDELMEYAKSLKLEGTDKSNQPSNSENVKEGE